LVTVEQFYPNRIVLDAFGDFVGRGIWTFVQDGTDVNVIYDWRIRAEKPLLRQLSWVLRRVFEANHRWAMRQGEESLRLELRRRRALSDEVRAAIPPPPGPVTYTGVALMAGVAIGVAGAAYLVRRARRRPRRAEDQDWTDVEFSVERPKWPRNHENERAFFVAPLRPRGDSSNERGER
jgi:hypothetical protein